MFVTPTDNGDDFLGFLWTKDRFGAGSKSGEAIRLVDGKMAVLQEETIRGKDRLKFFDGLMEGVLHVGQTLKNFLEGGEDEIDVSLRTGVSHDSDAPGFPGHGAKAGPDLNSVVVEEGGADGGIVGVFRFVDAVEVVERV